MAKEPGFANVKAQLTQWWNTFQVTRQQANIDKTAQRLYARKKDYYDPIEKQIGVPWYMVAVIDERESGATGGVLHNGEKIIGTGKKTKLVPAGRGPFSTWKSAAIDALTMPGKQFDKVPRDKWTIELVLYCIESYNGWGYRQYHPATPSPYVWSCTNIYDSSPKGKYVGDGVWGPGVKDTQIGVAPILKALLALDKTVPKVETDTKTPAPTTAGGATAGGIVVAGGTAAATAPTDYVPYIIAGTIIAAVVIGLLVYWYNKRKKAEAITEETIVPIRTDTPTNV